MSSEFDYQDDADALFNSTYMRWFHLHGKPCLVEITGVDRDVELTLPGGVKAKKPVVSLKKIQGDADVKPLVLNVTNKNELALFLGRSVSGWIGKQIVLYQSTAKLRGKDVPAIRVRKPKTK